MSALTLTIIQLAAGLLYAGGAALQWRHAQVGAAGTPRAALGFGTAGLILHTAAVAGAVLTTGGLVNLDLAYAVSLFLWLAMLQFLLATLLMEVTVLGLVLFPLGTVALVIEAFTPTGETLVIDASQPALVAHLVVSLLAYGTLTLAAIQAALLGIQERQIRRKHFGVMSRILPAVQPMEQLLFHLLRAGFALLTLVILSGVVFSEQVFGQPLTLDHKTLLTLIAWVVFGLLLWGHHHYGWRGQAAVRWTLSGYGLLILAYFGVRVVLELKA